MKHDPHERIELTGPWAGFGFQGGHMWTPEGHTLYPEDMAWWSLTCNIAREWRLMMAAARATPSIDSSTNERNPNAGALRRSGNVINLRDAMAARKERRSAGNGARFAAAKPVDQDRRGPRPPRRG